MALLAACGSGPNTDIERSLSFADRSDAEISRLVSAASGSEGFQAQASVASLDPSGEPDPDPCPGIAVSGQTVSVTGGCTTRDNMLIEGSARMTNPLGWGDGPTEIEYDFSEDTVIELDGLTFTNNGQTATRRGFSGTFIISSSFTEMSMDITSELLGISVRSDLDIDCGRSSCSISGGVELIGAGGAHVSGSINVSGQTATASYTIKGVDTVKVTTTNGCVAWNLEGTDRAFNPCNR